MATPAGQDAAGALAHAADMTGLEYLVVDLVIGRELGPLMLELNARPGLNAHLADRQGVRPRLAHAGRVRAGCGAVEARVAFARSHFVHHADG